MIRENINIKVSVVVVLVDDFTDAILPNGRGKVVVDGEKAPIPKNGGYYVFTNISKKEMVIRAEAFAYQSRRVTVDISESAKMKIIRIRLVPDKHYNLPEDATILYGTGKPGEVLELVCRENQTPLRLLKDYGRESQKIYMYNPMRFSIPERRMLITNGNEYEILEVQSQNNEEEFLLETPLRKDYKKAEGLIYLIHEIHCNENGEYWVPLPKLIKKNEEIICEFIDNGKLKKPIKITYGCENQIKKT